MEESLKAARELLEAARQILSETNPDRQPKPKPPDAPK